MSITSADILDRINDLRSRNEEFCVVTVVRTANVTSAKAGAKALVTSGGEIFGFVGGGCVTGAVKRVAAQVLASGEARLIRVKPKETVVEQLDADGVELHKSSCPSGGTVEMFIEPMQMAPRCIVCGASPVAASLVALAKAMGYRTVVAVLAEDQRPPARRRQLSGRVRSGLREPGRRRRHRGLHPGQARPRGPACRPGDRRRLCRLRGQPPQGRDAEIRAPGKGLA
ncbi:MAG: hypothetical protein IMF05_05195, partial [Proteobacteria bacterium]|nr:hypothetical protein [Pseudomonadota bacterium]